jgi:myosin heavy subunit
VESEQAAVKIQAAFRGFKDRQQVRKTKKAVVTIQATVRGFLARRQLARTMRRYVFWIYMHAKQHFMMGFPTISRQ